jgi:hypothetical protein
MIHATLWIVSLNGVWLPASCLMASSTRLRVMRTGRRGHRQRK